jgi:hypothetical protein
MKANGALDRSAFYKRRTTPNPGLDLSDHRLCSLLFRFLCTVLPSLCGKDATAIADLSQVLPPVYRGWTERVPSFDCTACCARSMSCSRAALHIAPCSPRQRQARRASRWGESLPTWDVANGPKTCLAQNQKCFANVANRTNFRMLRVQAAIRGFRDPGFSRATLAPVIQGETVTQTQCH